VSLRVLLMDETRHEKIDALVCPLDGGPGCRATRPLAKQTNLKAVSRRLVPGTCGESQAATPMGLMTS
jgi:hypothetical protein